MPLNNFTDLADYCLRSLGAPVVQINVTPEQIEDRIQDALEYFTEFHSEGTTRTYIPFVVSGSTLQLTTNVSSNFVSQEIVTGSISNATMILEDSPEINKIRSREFTGTFLEGETITGSISNTSAIIATSGISIGDIQNKYLTIPDEVISIIKVLPVNNKKNSDFMFDPQFQAMQSMWNIFNNYSSFDLSYYTTLQDYMSLLDFTLNTKSTPQFSRISGKVTLSKSFWDSIEIDQYIMIESHVSVANGVNTKIYDNFWIKKYATALLKRQWGQNLDKYENIILPGGVTLNGGKILEAALVDIEKLESMIKIAYTAPLDFYVG